VTQSELIDPIEGDDAAPFSFRNHDRLDTNHFEEDDEDDND
jgi:hypothetical protein